MKLSLWSSFVAVALLLSNIEQSVAAIRVSRLIDHVNGGAEIDVILTATDFHQFTQEDYLTIRCYPDGSAQLLWHVNSRFEDDLSLNSDVEYRFDDAQPHEARLVDISLADFYPSLQSHKRLSFQFAGSHDSSIFVLAGFKEKAGYPSQVGKQCGASLGTPLPASTMPASK